MARRGLTLLELLIVLGLLVALAAIAIPSLQGLLEKQSFELAVESTQQQLLLARAHAQATGQPVEIRWRAESNAVEARSFDPAAESASDSSQTGQADSEMAGIEGPGDPLQLESWATIELPRGVTIRARPPSQVLAGDSDETSSTTLELLADSSESETADNEVEAPEFVDIQLAVMTPDGGAMVGNDVWFADDAGRAGKLVINPMTGAGRWEPLDPAKAAEEHADAAIDDENVDDGDDEEAGDSEGDER
jgi:prepilin-type N-terminal cleavage/methylation domain-containing protein